MKRIVLGILAAVMTVAFAQAQYTAPPTAHKTVLLDAKGNPITNPKDDPHWNYQGNTYTNYHPGLSEGHHWWNPDGTEIYFQANWLPEGLVTLKMIDGMHDSFIANGQWCSHNARGRPTAGTGAARAQRAKERATEDDPRAKKPDPNQLNNNRNGCQPIVDAMPGDHWYKLHLNSHLRDAREQYALEPGHQ